MRIKVELHPDVYVYLSGLPQAERDDFLSRLGDVRRQPLRSSEAHFEPTTSRYVLRRFEFGFGVAKIAIFEFDPAEDRVRVLKCRPRKPRELRRRAEDSGSVEEPRGGPTRLPT